MGRDRYAQALLLVGALASCSSPGSMTRTSDAQAAAADYARAYCEKVGGCANKAIASRWGDESTCEARVGADAVARLSAPASGATIEWLRACAAALSTASCGDVAQRAVAACADPPGELTDGAGCAFASQCKSRYCDLSTRQACGTCAPPSSAGSSCATRPCASGLVCDGLLQVCGSVHAQGETCGWQAGGCAYGLGCVARGLLPGTCQPLLAAPGGPCSSATLFYPHCDLDQGFACTKDSTTSTCVLVDYVSAGARCGDLHGSYAECTDASRCVSPSLDSDPVCVALAKEGEPCGTAAPCMEPAVCVESTDGTGEGICQLRDAARCGT